MSEWVVAKDCPVCGRYAAQIERGELKPCVEWERPKAQPEAEEQEGNDE